MQIIIGLGALASFISGVMYVIATIRNKIQPNKITWLLWSVAPMISVVAGFLKEPSWALVPVFMAGFMPLLVFIASFLNRDSYWDITLLNLACAVISMLALLTWYFTKDPNLAIILSIIGDFAAALPTFIKVWRRPLSEIPWLFLTGVISPTSGLLVATRLALSQVGFSIYLVLLNLSLAFLIYGRRWYKYKRPGAKVGLE